MGTEIVILYNFFVSLNKIPPPQLFKNVKTIHICLDLQELAMGWIWHAGHIMPTPTLESRV